MPPSHAKPALNSGDATSSPVTTGTNTQSQTQTPTQTGTQGSPGVDQGNTSTQTGTLSNTGTRASWRQALTAIGATATAASRTPSWASSQQRSRTTGLPGPV